MGFKNLPGDWREQPLDNNQVIADVLDLCVFMKTRYEGALVVLVCDEQKRLLQPIQVDEIELDPPPDTDLMLNNLVTAIVGACAEARVIVAIARPGPLRIGARDEAWVRFIEDACRDRLPLLGVHVVTPSGSVQIRADPPAGTAGAEHRVSRTGR